jgi:arsenite methyltransferase
VAGALTERDFVTKLEKAGFVDVEIVERSPMGVDDCALYPLFTPDLLDLMRRLIPPERQGEVGVAVVLRARLPL